MALRKVVRLKVPNREKAQELFGSDQGDAQPGTELFVTLEGLPSFLLSGVGDQGAFPLGPDTLEERRLIGNECEWAARRFFRGFRR
jgi:hypothetical protein